MILIVSEKNDKQIEVNINLDTTPVLYTDRIGIVINSEGVVWDVMQRLGSTGKMRIVARIGMSHIHASRFVQELSKALTLTHKTQEKKAKN